MIREDHWLIEHAGTAVILGVLMRLWEDGHLGLLAMFVLAVSASYGYSHALWRLGLIDRAPWLVHRWHRITADLPLDGEISDGGGSNR